MAERELPKLEAAGSIPVTRSRKRAGGENLRLFSFR